MAKRVADAQIQRETYDSNESDDDMNQSTKVASSDVMNRRKIAMPKRRMAFKPLATSASDESKIASSFNSLKQANNSEAKADNDHITQNNSKLKALNLQFRTKIDELVSSEPLADLRPFFTKYEEYIKSILKASEESTESSKPTIQENGGRLGKVDDDQESSDSSSDEEVKVEGPKFTINSKPITSDSVFSFGAKKEKPKMDESDSESDIEIKGPEFTFSGAVSSDIFKLNPSTEKSEKNDEKSETATKPFSFTSTTPSSTTEENKDKNPFSFTASTKENESDNVNIKPSFTFGTQDVVDTQNKNHLLRLVKRRLNHRNLKVLSHLVLQKVKAQMTIPIQSPKTLAISMRQNHLSHFQYQVKIHLMQLSHPFLSELQPPLMRSQSRGFRLVQ